MSTATVVARFSISRTARLTRWNAVLLMRNRLAFVYAVVLPLLPLLLLLTGDRGSETIGASSIVTLFLVVGLFPVYYNVLSQFVSRRDELVLKRMRTGEARDGELLVSMPIILLASFGPLGAQISGLSETLRELIELTPGAAMAELVRVGWFGLDGADAETTTLSFAETWSHAAQPLLVIAAWTVVAFALAARSMRWEPRS